jgi:hypothetical protein
MRKELLKTISILILISSLTACNKPVEPNATPVDPGSGPLPTPKPRKLCANEYFPVKNKSTFAYSSTGGPSGPYSFTRTFSNKRADGFTINTRYKNKKIVQDWSCKPEGLVPNIIGATDKISMLAFEKFTDLSTSNITGYVMPPAIVPGTEWSYALDIQGKERVKEGTPASMTGRISVNYSAGNKEKVTVPAGSFDAIAIEVNTRIDFKMDSGGNVVTLSMDSTYTAWYAPGIGWVKSSGYGKLGGQDYVETIVLESYNIP